MKKSYFKSNESISPQRCNSRMWLSKIGIMILSIILSSQLLMAQQTGQQVSGNVTDVNSSPLPGVNILIKGTSNGTVTDINGHYSLTVNSSDVLLFSYIGFIPKEVIAGNQSTIDVILTEEVSDLNEVVVVGYGIQKKSLVTGAISSVKADDIKNSSVTRAEQALQGRTAGVTVLPTSGAPGASLKVRIRGTSSQGNVNPLYIVDGVKTGDINYLDPNDIERMEILKDGASCAIYGSEGGNGVVIITTKSGSKDKGSINYEYQYGWQSAAMLPELMEAQAYADYWGITATSDEINTNTDWLDAVTETAALKKHHLAFTGGSDKSSYALSGSYVDQDGIVGGDQTNFKRYTARLNSDHEIKKWLKVGNKFSYSRTERKNITEDDAYSGVIAGALMIDPLTPTIYKNGVPAHVQAMIDSGKKLRQTSDGLYYGNSQYVRGESVNPLVSMDIKNGGVTNDKILGNVYAELTPLKGLKITSSIGLDMAYQNNHYYNGEYYYSDERQQTTSIVDNWDRWHKWQFDNYASYNTLIKEDHNLTVMVGMSAEKYTHRFATISASPMQKESPLWDEIDFMPGVKQGPIGGNSESISKASYFGRFSYSYMDRYLLEGTLRYDGASEALLAPGNLWQMFPSLSAGWVFTQEDFMSNSFLSYGKLRLSWGQNGNVNSLNPWEYLNAITTSGIRYPNSSGSFITGGEPNRLANKDLTWETIQQSDIGVDLRALDNKLSFTIDYYNKQTKDMLIDGKPAVETGVAAPKINGGTVKNTGWEFEIGYNNRDHAFKYGIDLNISAFMKNEVTEVAQTSSGVIEGARIGSSWASATRISLHEPIWYFYGYKTNGFDTNGDVIFVDQLTVDTNGDGKMDKADGIINENDKVNIGDPHANTILGANLSAEYKGFDLNIFVQGMQGNEVVVGFMRTDRSKLNRPTFITDKIKSDADQNVFSSDQMVYDGSFYRIKQIQIGYDLTKSLIKTKAIANARIYASLENYFTFTSYEGMDPEANGSADNSAGVDRGYYPIPKTATLGISITF
jgi:TonB-linked SusC/RagA family outer membrane protein